MGKLKAGTRTIFGLSALALMAGCGVTQATKDSVARSETSVMQAQQVLGNSESGALELQRARGNLEQAKQAIEDGDDEQAMRLAHEATLDAELATAKSQSARARRGADEVHASIETLRKEAQRLRDPVR